MAERVIMFERYTEPARRALFFSRYEVSRLGGDRITSEHLLLGVLREMREATWKIASRARIDLSALQEEIRRRCARGETLPTSFEIPFGEDTKRILYRAAAEADALGHRSISPDHLVLAVLADAGSDAAQILVDHGIVVEDVRGQLADTPDSVA